MNKFRLISGLFLMISVLLSPGSEVRGEPRMTYRYVVPAGSTTSPQCTRDNPCDLRYAIDVVADDGDTLIVHSGTYTASLPTDDLIFIDKNLSLWGSCEFDATHPFRCYPDEQNSILDGEGDRRVIRVEGALGDEQVHIEGFTIMRGLGTAPGPCWVGYDGCGGGINLTNLQKLTLKNNTIWQNKAGNGDGLGGGLYVDEVDFLQVEGNTFQFNRASQSGLGLGGAAFVTYPDLPDSPNTVVFERNLITGNETSSFFHSSSGGAGLSIFYSNNVQITNNDFNYQNSIERHFDLRGSSIFLYDSTGLSIEGNSFSDDYGRSVLCITGWGLMEGQVMRNQWWGNIARTNLDIEGRGVMSIMNNFFGRQIVSPLPHVLSKNITLVGIPAFTEWIDVDIQFNTFAAADIGIEIQEYSDVEIFNNIFTEMTTAIHRTTTIPANMLIDNNLYYHIDSIGGGIHTNPIYEDPKLMDVANGDFHLRLGSRAIDQAYAEDFDLDIDGDIRPLGTGMTPYDLGADEFVVYNYLPLLRK